ncbi:MAG: DUF3772 domain-containing protein [Xanthomonadaceae bacterium]|nr:DUF3772 domain-containing protein [Xanthomonadaceae bacterium]MDE1963306.1 mechanosensitive ion channel family protein [Xanthomonadaceae bacterium]
MCRRLRLLLTLLLLCASATALARQAATPATPPSPDQVLAQMRNQLDAVKKSLDDKPDAAALADLRSQALAVEDQASGLAGTLAPQVQAAQAQLAVLGPAPDKRSSEAPEVREQRRRLEKAQADVDAQMKQAQLMGQEADQLATQLSDVRRNEFQARLAERTATPFSRAFWSDPLHSLPADLRRLRSLGDDLRAATAEAWKAPNRSPFLACLVAAALLLGVGRWLLERGLLRFTQNRVPAGHLRRSALALAIATLTSLNTGLAAELVFQSLDWNGLLDDDLRALGLQMVRLVLLSAYIAGLGRALLSATRPSWRMPALSDAEARALRPLPWRLAAAIAVLGTMELVNHAISASLPATVATRGLIALVISALLISLLVRQSRARRAELALGQTLPGRPLWVGLGLAVLVLSALFGLLGVATGYIALAFFIAVNTIWIGVVVSSLYLLSHVLNDLWELLLSPRGSNGQRLQKAFEVTSERLEQGRTVLAGLTRALAVLLAIGAVVSRLGASPEDLSASVGSLLGGLDFGELKLAPADILKAMAVLVAGLFVVRVIKRWLDRELLPNTRLDPGMRSSMVTLLGYVGGVLVVVMALATLKVSLQNIAWIASALSVGIGFGLQAIVSNFISGLILLAERPVKVGDWISLNGVEGDIRRINVRATEIQLWDRSTVIVPNSQLITQNVRNVTLADAIGRVKFQLPMPLDTDAARARELILDVLRAHPATLEDPAPFVQLDSVDATHINLSAYAYTRSPRESSGVRSDLLFAVLARLREENLRLIRPQDMVVHTAHTPRPDLRDAPAGTPTPPAAP